MAKSSEPQQSLADKLADRQRQREQAETLAPGQSQASQPGEGQMFAAPGQKGGQGPDYGYDRFRLHRHDEVSAYTAGQDARYALDPRSKKVIAFGLVTLATFILTLLLPNDVFNPMAVNHDLAWFVAMFQQNAADMLEFCTTGNTADGFIFAIYTAVVTAFVGAALGATEACYQGALKNAMASPTTLGIMSGGTVGGVLYVLTHYSIDDNAVESTTAVSLGDAVSGLSQLDPISYVMLFFEQSFYSLAGCFIVVALVLAIAHIAGHGKVSNTALIIAGQVIAALATAIIQLVRYYLAEVAPESSALTAVQNLQNGSAVTTSCWEGVVLVVVPISICFVILYFLTKRLNVLAFSDEEARSMGISTLGTRNLLVALCTIMTAIAVSFYGMMGMVGFMVPLIVRRIIGSDFRFVVPASALAGATMLLATYYFTSLSIAGISSGRGMGMFTSIVGAIVFIITIIKQRGQRNVDWV